jgi:esterase/lipase
MSMAPFLHVVEKRVMIWGLGRAVSVARQISEKVQNDSSNPDKSAKTRPDKVVKNLAKSLRGYNPSCELLFSVGTILIGSQYSQSH